jgi:hypothetical protein
MVLGRAMMLNMDFRFLEDEIQFFALEDMLGISEQSLQSAIEKERARFEAMLRKYRTEADDPERQDIQRQLDDMIENVLPRHFRNAFVVSLYASVETGILDVAKYIQEKRGITKDIYKQCGRDMSFLQKARRYFSNEIHFPLLINARVFALLNILRVLRNAIVHSTARIDIRLPRDRQFIRALLRTDYGISVDDGYIILSFGFLQKVFPPV